MHVSLAEPDAAEPSAASPATPFAALDTRVVLVAPQHPGNIGACARAMKTMGLHDLVLVSPKALPTDAEAVAMASGADDVLAAARVVETLASALEGCAWVAGSSARPRHISVPVVSARDWLAPYVRAERAGKLALLFGRERTGLSNEEMMRCHELVMIPANPAYSSLNIAAAAQVLCYELRLAAEPGLPAAVDASQPEAREPVDGAEMERFYDHLERFLVEIRFLNPANPRTLMRRLRRLFGRAAPDANEMNILRGVLTEAGKALGRARHESAGPQTPPTAGTPTP